MILTHDAYFTVKKGLFFTLPDRHITTVCCPFELPNNSELSSDDIDLYLGCHLDFELFFHCSPEDHWHRAFTSDDDLVHLLGFFAVVQQIAAVDVITQERN